MTEPASIRYRNPGAMWGSALAKKWGALPNAVVLHDGLGQGNNIAVFPDYVHGICAQIDLWRTPRYHNKKFKDAIAIWSGGNYVASYIQFVTSRVPGMTADTIIDDAFLNSPSGIAFLKAQAWHEAGKKYPAPDTDWIEAQRRVFGGAAAPAPEADDHDPPLAPAHDTKWLQTSLNKLGAHPVLLVDGIVGTMLRAAIRDYQAKNGLDADGLVGPATIREIESDLSAVPAPTPAPVSLPPEEPSDPLQPSLWQSIKSIFIRKG